MGVPVPSHKRGGRVSALSSICSAVPVLTMNIVIISRASNHRAQLAVEKGKSWEAKECITQELYNLIGAEMYYISSLQSD